MPLNDGQQPTGYLLVSVVKGAVESLPNELDQFEKEFLNETSQRERGIVSFKRWSDLSHPEPRFYLNVNTRAGARAKTGDEARAETYQKEMVGEQPGKAQEATFPSHTASQWTQNPAETHDLTSRGRRQTKIKQREVRWYAFTTNSDTNPDAVLDKLVKDVQQKNQPTKENGADLPYPTLKIDRRTLTTTADGGIPTNVPVRGEAIPEPQVAWSDYCTQDCLTRVGLDVKREANTKITTQVGRADLPFFKVHDQAQGANTMIVILDTAPLPGQLESRTLGELSGVDWSNIEALVDLSPEDYTAGRQALNPNDYPDRPKYKAVKYHGMMVANLCKMIAPQSRIVLVRALDNYGEGATPSINLFINFMVNHAPGRTYGELFGITDEHANQLWLPTDTQLIFNLSWVISGTKDEDIYSYSLLEAIEGATSQPRVTSKVPVFVCAAGNDSYSGVPFNPDEPAAYGYFPGYTWQDYEEIDNNPPGKMLTETPPSSSPLVDDPYNMVVGVASSSRFASFLYANFSNASPISAPAVESWLDPGCELKLADVNRLTSFTKGQFVYKPDGSYEETDPAKEVPAEYVCWSGTSFAAPLVTGQVALLVGERLDKQVPTDPTRVKELVWTSARQAQWWNRSREINIAASLAAQTGPDKTEPGQQVKSLPARLLMALSKLFAKLAKLVDGSQP